MKRVNEVIIVEGKHDIARLKAFLDADIIETKGSSLPDSTINLIKELESQGREFLILTDPDYPGEQIRNKLLKIIPNARQAFIPKERARTSKKVGIEHANEEDIIEAISNNITYKEDSMTLSWLDYLDLNLSGKNQSKENRKKLGQKLHIGEANSKTLYKRLNMLGISKEELKKILEEIRNG